MSGSLIPIVISVRSDWAAQPLHPSYRGRPDLGPGRADVEPWAAFRQAPQGRDEGNIQFPLDWLESLCENYGTLTDPGWLPGNVGCTYLRTERRGKIRTWKCSMGLSRPAHFGANRP